MRNSPMQSKKIIPYPRSVVYEICYAYRYIMPRRGSFANWFTEWSRSGLITCSMLFIRIGPRYSANILVP